MAQEQLDGFPLVEGDQVTWRHASYLITNPEDMWSGEVVWCNAFGFAVRWREGHSPVPYSWQYIHRGWIVRVPGVSA